jgi:hypothetical protein
MISLIQLINKIKTFCDNHEQIKRFNSDFAEQMPNFASQSEEYPIVYLVPVNKLPLENTNIYSVDIYCWDILQKNRANSMIALSDTDLILTDLYRYIKYGDDYSYDILNNPIVTPLNNGLLDFTVGNVIRLDIELGTYCPVDIPII